MLVAGEASGDLHGATLARALRAAAPHARLTGMGGRQMAAEGVELLVDVTASATMGGTEAVGGVPSLYRAYRRLRAVVTGPARPDALVVIDFPEFNLRLARAARRSGVAVAYFIPPQIWAWRPWRVHLIRRVVSLVLAVFPFETALYRRARVPVAFVGHPVLDALADAPSRAQARRELGLEGDAPVIGLLPGSRRQEIVGVMPAMREAAGLIAAAHPGARFVVAQAPTVDVRDLRTDDGPPLRVVAGRTYAVMRAADLLLVTSGTATLEAALLGTPMVVCYRLSRLSELLFKPLVRVPWISLANIALGRGVVPELYQRTLTGPALGREALRLLDSPAALARQREAFAELAGQLGEPGVGARAARHILELATQPRASSTGHPRLAPASRSPLQMIERLLPPLAAVAVTGLGMTLSVRAVGMEALRPFWQSRRPLIYAVWHGRILMVPWLNARLRGQDAARRVRVLASRSRDGQLIAEFARRFGLQVVRGSSSRGGWRRCASSCARCAPATTWRWFPTARVDPRAGRRAASSRWQRRAARRSCPSAWRRGRPGACAPGIASWCRCRSRAAR